MRSNRMESRAARAETARGTLEILKKGSYTSPGNKEVALSAAMDFAVKNSQLIAPEMERELEEKLQEVLSETGQKPKSVIEVTDETTLAAARRLVQQESFPKVACLNFASAVNPGGGFLDGSSAQEESIARATGLYPCIAQFSVMYETNRRYRSALYTDFMIYSPQVPVFRDDRDQLLEQPFFVSIITAPAVNAGIVKSREPHNIPRIEEVMVTRIGKILAAAAVYRHDALVLGAYGCGVFQNNPTDVAGYFARFLGPGGRFENVFRRVTFAVPEKGRSKRNHHVFKEVLSF